jgi:hypothetical protein
VSPSAPCGASDCRFSATCTASTWTTTSTGAPGGLARDIERGTSGISFLLRFFIFNIAPTLFEIAMVAGILFVSYGAPYALIVLAVRACSTASIPSAPRAGARSSCAR